MRTAEQMRIKEIAQKYEKNSIVEQYDKLIADQQLKVGFVGMFSAGKTSLINSLLGIHLPVDPAPTTKSICVIESTDSLTEYEYYMESGIVRNRIGFSDFQDLLDGKATGTAVVRLSANAGIPGGIVYVDTPGVDNFSAEESDLTYRYLSLLDAAVVCIDAGDGTVRQNLLDFISEPALSALSSRMIFVLTHADLKTAQAVETVKREVVAKLRGFSARTPFDCGDIEERVIAVNANNHASAMQVVEKLERLVVGSRNEIWRRRVDSQLGNLAKQLALILQDEADALTCDTSQLDEKKRQTEEAVRALEGEIEKRSRTLENVCEKLVGQIKSILLGHELDISHAASTEEIKNVFIKINSEIVELVKAQTKALGDFNIPVVENLLGTDILVNFKRIDTARDLSVQVSTALLTAWLLPGGGAVNLAEGVGGAAAQTAGKAAQTAGKASRAAGKASQAAEAGAAGAGAAGAGAAGAAESTMATVLRVIGKILHDINPLEMIGDWVALELKHNTYVSMANVKSVQIANSVLTMLEEPFEEEVIVPLRNRCVEQRISLDNLIAQKRQGITDFAVRRAQLLDAISELNCM